MATLGGTSIAKQCGNCPYCGGILYERLTHGCLTSVRGGSAAAVQPTVIPLRDLGGGTWGFPMVTAA